MFRLLFKISLLFSLLFCIRCAQIVSPSGGDPDEDPPVLDTLSSSENFQTNFTKQELVFWFDEWIKLKDVFTQVVVSPPLRYQPQVTVKNKSVRFAFDEREELKENATYVINFGEAIQDFTEGNPTELRYVFSTGNFIDSLSIGGSVVDAFSGEKVEGVLVMLYDNLSDTVVRTERPFYFAKTDEAGRFKIENVRADSFKLFALEDSGLDYLYTNETERIGYLDSVIVVNKQKQPRNLQISFFEAVPTLLLEDELQDEYGLVRLAFNRQPYDAVIDYPDFGQTVVQEVKEDSILIWYEDPSGGTWDIYIGDAENQDTISVEAYAKATFAENDSLFLENKKFGKQKVNPKKEAQLTFNHPIDSLDLSKFILTQDTLKKVVNPSFSVDTEVQRTVVVEYKWKENTVYDLTVLPGALTDIFGLQNKDTITINYEVGSIKSFGNILLTVDSLDSNKNYVFELMKKDEVIKTLKTTGQATFKHDFIAFPPGVYRLRIVEDTDNNGRWSPGNYDLKTQSERVFEKAIEELRANWDVEARIVIE